MQHQTEKGGGVGEGVGTGGQRTSIFNELGQLGQDRTGFQCGGLTGSFNFTKCVSIRNSSSQAGVCTDGYPLQDNKYHFKAEIYY